MTASDSLRRLVATYRQSRLLAGEARAVDTAQTRVDRSRPGTIAPSFGEEAPLAVRMERWFDRAAALWEYELKRERDGAARAQLPDAVVDMIRDLNGIGARGSRAAQDREILQTKGDATIVGLLFGRRARQVQELRARHGQDPHTGEPAATKRPLTSRELPVDADAVEA